MPKWPGFGSKTGIDLPNETRRHHALHPWKLRTFRQKWYAGETISVAIGQGAVTVSPLELGDRARRIGVRGQLDEAASGASRRSPSCYAKAISIRRTCSR